MPPFTFPKDFLWGAATSAHQVEGNTTNSDWWAWEQTHAGQPNGPVEPSGIACDSYNRYESDFKLAKELNHTIHRLSIEWSRIEPREGHFDQKELEHYKEVLKSVRAHGMKTFVTLWHYTLPLWLSQKGGFEHKDTPALFARYARFIADELGEYIDFFSTYNEVQLYLANKYFRKVWFTNQRQSLIGFCFSAHHFIQGHKLAYIEIKSSNPQYIVGAVEAFMFFEPKRKNALYKAAMRLRTAIQQGFYFAHFRKYLDFIGVNYYFHDIFGIRDFLFRGKYIETTGEVNDWGYQIYPSGIYNVVMGLRKYRIPIIITENGLPDMNDEKRESFIVRHLYYLHKAINAGAKVLGYIHWSLLDNFEWAEGYRLKFGLIAVDRAKNLERTIRNSARTFAEICKSNELPAALLKKFGL